MTFPTATTRALVATVSALAILASGCATGTADLDAAEPASAEPDAVGDPDLDSGEDPDGGVLVDDPADDVAATGAAATSTASPPAARPITSAPVPEPAGKSATSAPLRDGTYEGRLVRIDRQHLTVDLVRILSGEAAREAAEEAGDLDDDGTLPNDVYVEDLGERVTVAIAGDGGFQVYDCSAGCELVSTTLEALVDGTTRPYGGANAHFTFRVDHAEAVSLVEVYLP